MHILLIGASGMVGQAALVACIADPGVTQVTALVRSPLGIIGGKVRELLCPDLFQIGTIADQLGTPDACLFCAGVSSVGMTETDYRHTTYDLTLTVANFLVTLNPRMRFLYVTGRGTDSTEKGSLMWARVKGATENALLRVGFAGVALFRPAYIQPFDGVRARISWHNALCAVIRPIYPLLLRFVPNAVTDTRILGRAMLIAVQPGAPTGIMEPRDINRLGQS